MRPIDTNTKHQLNVHLETIEKILTADALTIISPIMFGLDGMIKRAIEQFPANNNRLVVILDTPGGIAEGLKTLRNWPKNWMIIWAIKGLYRSWSVSHVYTHTGVLLMTNTKKVILDRNKKIDREVVAAFAALQKQLPSVLGWEHGASYNLSYHWMHPH